MLTRRRAALLALSLTLLPLAIGRQEAPTVAPHTVILVRHAEKDSAKDKTDPPLTEAGTQRAKELARLLAHAGVTRLVASEFKRTQATLAPLAQASGLAVETRPAKDTTALAAELAAAPAGSITLVAAHSNTVPALAKALGVTLTDLDANGYLADDQYDRLFVLTLGIEGASTLAENAPGTLALELRYGTPREE
jgi:broad specificity phosphatase PhoE